ncbi:MAG: FtsX-like permease family protein [Ardenticatenaceae bacterium]|nr:FtsX-like permease family protein [Ardenticatenaceae bacterium]
MRVALRYLLRRPLQSILIVVGIALGVAVVIAIDVANESASRAFELSTEAVAGRATHQIVGGPGGVPTLFYRKLRTELGARPVAPVVEVCVRADLPGGQPLHLLGVDPFAEPPFRDYLGNRGGLSIEALSALVLRPNTVLLPESLARRSGLEVNSILPVQVGSRTVRLRVVGLLRADDETSRRALEGLLLADIATAQEVLGSVGYLSRIDLIATPEGRLGRATLAGIQAVLPSGLRLERSSTRSAAIEQMTRAFELNLTALSLLALVVGMFLIYNTMMFSVVQRRAVLGTLRALGVTREEVFGVVLVEALALGVIGAVVGVALGLVLSRGMVRLVTQTINDLYFVVSVREPVVSLLVLLKGAGLGIVATLLSSLLPAVEATLIPPHGALVRSEIEDRIRVLLPWLTVLAVGLLVLGVLVLRVPTRRVDVAFAGLFCVVIGFALLTPMATVVLMALVRPLTVRLFGILGQMAPRDIVRALSRTSVAMSALMVAVSVIIGVGVMIGSFRQTVEVWLATTLEADIYVSPPSLTASRVEGVLDPQIVAQLVATPGVVRSATARTISVVTGEGNRVGLVAISADAAGEARRFLWHRGSVAERWQRMAENAVLVSEPFARRYGIMPMSTVVMLQTDRGPYSFEVVGVFYDYASDQGTVLMRDVLYHQYWDDRAISSLALWVAPGRDVDALVERLRAEVAGRGSLVIRSNRGLRQSVMEVFDRAFAITAALRLLAVVVAFVGVLSALMALQLERAWEFGVLRAAGMTVRQLWGLTVLETGLMGVTAGLLALPTGLALALVLIYVINVRSFGWTLQLAVEPGVFVQALAVALLAALLSGLYPALRAGRLPAAEVLRGE